MLLDDPSAPVLLELSAAVVLDSSLVVDEPATVGSVVELDEPVDAEGSTVGSVVVVAEPVEPELSPPEPPSSPHAVREPATKPISSRRLITAGAYQAPRGPGTASDGPERIAYACGLA